MKSLEQLLAKKGLESFGRFYGIYSAIVVDDSDSEGLGRVGVIIPELLPKDRAVWASAVGFQSGKGYGSYSIPVKGEMVYVMFRNGDISFPLWIYGGFSKGQKPEEFEDATITGFKSFGGHLFMVDDENGTITVKSEKGSTIIINDDEESITVTTSGDSKIFMDKDENIQLENASGTILQVSKNHLQMGKKSSPDHLVKAEDLKEILEDLVAQITSPEVWVDSTGVAQPFATYAMGMLKTKLTVWKQGLGNFFSKYS